MRQPRAQQITTIALAAAVTLVAILGIQNRSLKRRYGRLLERSAAPYRGLAVPAFDAVTPVGDTVTIGSAKDGEKQLLFFFSSTCPMSRNTLPAWNEIASEAEKRDPVSVYGIQLDTMNLELQDAGFDHLNFPVLRFPDSRLQQCYGVRGVPVTVLLNYDGRVLYSKLGEIAERPIIDSVLATIRDDDPFSRPLATLPESMRH